MSEAHFLRVAHPLELWDGTRTAAEVAQVLASEQSWSLFIRLDDLDPLIVLGAFYGWRTGRGPLHDHGYVVFAESELRLSEGVLIRLPDHFTFGWPPEVRDAHYDLEGHTPSGAAAFAKKCSMSNRLHRVTRLEVLLAQYELSLRIDAPAQFIACVRGRLAKLAKNEGPVMTAFGAALAAKGLPPLT